MSQMPEIKGVVNKEPDRDKKKAGLLARLFGGGGSGGSGLGGLGGFGGGAGGGMGALAGGGILATKAGLLALLLAGTTVAGGIGMLGYRLFGPGAGDSTTSSDNLQLFAPKQKEAASADGQSASKDGSSESLKQFNEANKTPTPADAAANGAVKDATAAGATAASGSDAAAAAAAAVASNKMGETDTGNGVNKGLLKNTAKFGTLSGATGGGGSGAVANSGAKTAGDAGSKGSLSGFKKPSAATVSGGTARSIAGRHFNGAAQQGFGVLGSQHGAQSSAGAGQVYDGAANGGSNIGGAGTPIGGAATPGTGPAQPTSLNAPAILANSNAIPTPIGEPVCPWQNQIKEAQVLMGIATALLLVCSLINKSPGPHTLVITQVIGYIVAGLGAMVVLLGGIIAHGKYGQLAQGAMLGAAGAGMILAGMMAATSTQSDATKAKDAGPSTVTTTPGANGSSVVSTQAGTPAVSASPGANSVFKGGLGGMDPFVMLGGGLVVAGLIGTMMMPPKKYPAQEAKDPNWPKGGLVGYQQFPSEQALKKMVA